MKTVAIIAFPEISLFHLSVPIAIFNDAMSVTVIDKANPFKTTIYAEHKGLMNTADGQQLQIDHSLEELELADLLVIPSWHPNLTPSEQLTKTILNHYQAGKQIAGLCLGSFALAHAGILNNKQATTHWKFADEFNKQFPQVELDTNPLFIKQDNIITSAGSAASIDCCLQMLKIELGSKRANQVARLMVSSPQRDGGQNQYIELPTLQTGSDFRLAQLTEEVANNPQNEYNLTDVANKCSMSVRSFSRHFNANYGVSFVAWLTNIRLNRSLELLESSQLTISQISESTGFKSEQTFRKHFNKRFEISPNAWRKTFNSS